MNKMINGKRLTIQFYVDDLKCSDLDQSVLDNIVKELNDVFCTSKKEIAETKGDIHEYLGLTLISLISVVDTMRNITTRKTKLCLLCITKLKI